MFWTAASIRVLTALLVLLAVTAQADVGERIYGGVPEERLSETAVALVRALSFQCSGVLVGPRIVLTAGHCIPRPVDLPYTTVTVRGIVAHAVGSDVATEYLRAGSPYTRSAYDLGALYLDQDIPDPLALRTAPLAVGEEVSLYGYGLSAEPNTGGRSARARITALPENRIEFRGSSSTGTICNGDSGGPAIDAMGRVIGLASVGTNVGIYALGGVVCSERIGGVAYHVSLLSNEARAFLERVFSVPTLPGLRASIATLSERATILQRSSGSGRTARRLRRVRYYLAQARLRVP